MSLPFPPVPQQDSRPASGYRPDIDGLRAIAVVLVAGYFLMFPSDCRLLGKQVVAGAGFAVARVVPAVVERAAPRGRALRVPSFCRDGACMTFSGADRSEPVAFDYGHLSRSASLLLAARIRTAIFTQEAPTHER